jgi:phosphoribosylpyrophosphate synthetase
VYALHCTYGCCVRRGERTDRDGRQLVGSVAGADCILVDDQIFSGARQSLRGTLHATCNEASNVHHD